MFDPSPAWDATGDIAALAMEAGAFYSVVMSDTTAMPFNALAHADWSVDWKRRWRVLGVREGVGWRIDAAAPVDASDGFLEEARRLSGPVLAGADLPIGAPATWAALLDEGKFLDLAKSFGAGPWADFYVPASTYEEVRLHRPFFPAGNGVKGQHKHCMLARALGVPHFDGLRRWCEFDEHGKRSGTPLFWTNGPAQVGKAALHFWREELAPQIVAGRVAIWPFEGDLAALAASGRTVVAETYPGEAYGWFDLEVGSNKRRKSCQSDRANDADRLLRAGERLGAAFAPLARAQINCGFAEGGDDAFDAMVGALALLSVIQGARADHAPKHRNVRLMEGWILGRRPAALGKLPHRMELRG